MIKTTPLLHKDDEISLLDILVTLVESWRLLIFGPVIVSVLAGALSFLWPKTFESVAIVRLTEEEVAFLHTTLVLDSLIEGFSTLANEDRTVDEARQELKKRISFTVDKQTKLVTITVKAATPEQAQAFGGAVIAAVLKELQIKGHERALLEVSIKINERAIQTAEDAIEAIQRNLKKNALSDQAQESAVKNLAAISSDVAKRSQENEVNRLKLEVRGDEVFVQSPSLPGLKSSPKLSLVMVLALFGSALALLLFVFVRKAWDVASQDQLQAKKIAHLKRLLGFRV